MHICSRYDHIHTVSQYPITGLRFLIPLMVSFSSSSDDPRNVLCNIFCLLFSRKMPSVCFLLLYDIPTSEANPLHSSRLINKISAPVELAFSMPATIPPFQIPPISGSPERSGLMGGGSLPPLPSSAPPKLNLISTGAFHSPDIKLPPTVTSPE